MRDGRAAEPLVLLVEDSFAIRDAFTILLEESGYRVLPAADGPEALELAAGDRPDLVLLDMGLPGMDGLEVVRRLKADPATAKVPVLAITGRDDARSRRDALDAGCAAFILKPVNTHALLRAIPIYLGGEAES